jgi:glycosyltransferase involved in cell wall biosynthesis
MRLAQYDRLVRLAFWASRRIASLAHLIIVNSFAGRDYHVNQGYPARRMVVIHNGIDVNRFVMNLAGRQRYRREWRVAEKEVLIGLVARLDPMKDHMTFLRAAGMLLEQRKDARFVCIGEGPMDYADQLRAAAKELGHHDRIVWAGTYEDMASVYSAVDIATSSSAFGEGFSNVLAEAMACGVPCVATNVGDSAVIIGDIGVLVPPRDPASLAAAWLLVIDRMEQGKIDHEQIRRHITENFSIDCLAERTLAELQRCA